MSRMTLSGYHSVDPKRLGGLEIDDQLYLGQRTQAPRMAPVHWAAGSDGETAAAGFCKTLVPSPVPYKTRGNRKTLRSPAVQAGHLGPLRLAVRHFLRAISLIWRRYDGREVVLYLLEGELASHNRKGERENDPERKFSDAGRQVAAEEDARQRAHQQRAEYVPIDRAQHPVPAPGDERQGHRMGDVGADDPRHGKVGIKQD